MRFIMFALLFFLPPSRNSDPGSHSRLFSPPTHYGSCLAFFYCENTDSPLFFPRRLARVECQIFLVKRWLVPESVESFKRGTALLV